MCWSWIQIFNNNCNHNRHSYNNNNPYEMLNSLNSFHFININNGFKHMNSLWSSTICCNFSHILWNDNSDNTIYLNLSIIVWLLSQFFLAFKCKNIRMKMWDTSLFAHFIHHNLWNFICCHFLLSEYDLFFFFNLYSLIQKMLSFFFSIFTPTYSNRIDAFLHSILLFWLLLFFLYI